MTTDCPAPIFIIGMVRSGTSLLHALLNGHPQVSLMYECDVWAFPRFLSRLRFGRDWLARQEFFNGSLSRHGLLFAGTQRGLEGVHKPEDLYQTFADRKGATLYGEKSPFYGPYLNLLREKYPNARFILIWRDPVDIYRSICRAARGSKFFERRGGLNRLISNQEKMIADAATLTAQGALVHHIHYQELITAPEEACRRVCDFLKVDYAPAMLNLAEADLSAVYAHPHHSHLRGGVIEASRPADLPGSPGQIAKLERFTRRWNRQSGAWQTTLAVVPDGAEPSLWERTRHRFTGAMLHSWDGAKRALFEFLPLAWLRTYRQIKLWMRTPSDSSVEPLSAGPFLAKHLHALATSIGVMALIGVIDYATGPEATMAPFYLIPVLLISLRINRFWGGLTAAAAAIVWSGVQYQSNPGDSGLGVLVWNCVMRYFYMHAVVLMVNRGQLNPLSETPTTK